MSAVIISLPDMLTTFSCDNWWHIHTSIHNMSSMQQRLEFEKEWTAAWDPCQSVTAQYPARPGACVSTLHKSGTCLENVVGELLLRGRATGKLLCPAVD